MIDNDIIKALECCIKSANAGECLTLKCPLLGDYGCAISGDEEKLYEYALDLINRQKAEVERLKEILMNGCKLSRCINKGFIRAEAYKEFAERLKAHLLLNIGERISVVSADDVEKLLKELTEKNDKE